MTKKEAVMAMLEGKKVALSFWNADYYIYMNEDLAIIDAYCFDVTSLLPTYHPFYWVIR